MLTAKRRTGIARFRDGPRRSRVKLGPRAFVFFVVSALLLGAYAIAVNLDAEDRLNAYWTRPPAHGTGN